MQNVPTFNPENYEYPQKVAEALANPRHESASGSVFIVFNSKVTPETQELKIRKLFNVLTNKVEIGLQNGWLEPYFFMAPSVVRLYDGTDLAWLNTEERELASDRFAFCCFVKSNLTREQLNELYGEEVFTQEGHVGPTAILR